MYAIELEPEPKLVKNILFILKCLVESEEDNELIDADEKGIRNVGWNQKIVCHRRIKYEKLNAYLLNTHDLDKYGYLKNRIHSLKCQYYN